MSVCAQLKVKCAHINHTEWKPTTGVIVPIDNVGDSGACLLSRCTGVDDCSDIRMVAPTGGGNWPDRVNNDDGVVAHSSNSLDLKKVQWIEGGAKGNRTIDPPFHQRLRSFRSPILPSTTE